MNGFAWILLGTLLGVCAEWLVPRVLSRAGQVVPLAAALLVAEGLTRGSASSLGLLGGFAIGVGLQAGLLWLLERQGPAGLRGRWR